MEDIDSYTIEATRIRRSVVLYSELFEKESSVSVLSEQAGKAFSVIQRSMHDEILISLSRLFDTDCYKTKNQKYEYLSQRNIVKKYKASLTDKANIHRDETTKLKQEINIQDYRDLKVAHNDKPTLVSSSSSVKHGISSNKVLDLLDHSIQLMLCLKSSLSNQTEVSIPVDLNNKLEGVGNELVAKLRKI